MRVRIRGKRWVIRDDTRIKYAGWCHYDKHLIRVRKNQEVRERLDTLIHELLHARQPGWGERDVWSMAKVVSKVLWQDGWRRIEK